MALVTCSNRHQLRVKGSPVGSEKLLWPGALSVHLTPLAAQITEENQETSFVLFYRV